MSPRTEETSGLHVLLLLMFVFTCGGELSSQDFPGLDTCGRPSKQYYSTRIINGSPVELGEYPWMANLGYTTNPPGDKIIWKSAGSLITDRYVITAAHCVNRTVLGNDPYSYVTKVRLGELDLDPTKDDKANPMDFEVESIVQHRGYSPVQNINDIALIKLKDKVTFTDFIRPICLPPIEFQRSLFEGYSPTVSGWGRTIKNSTDDNNTQLLKTEVQIKDTTSCRANITSVPLLRYSIIDNRVVCASSVDTDACKGDSGGPLTLFRYINRSGSNKPGNYFLMGIVSYSHKCALEGYPGVYTRVSMYMDWIINIMDNNMK